MFAPLILLISHFITFHSIIFFFDFSNLTIYPIPFYFFQLFKFLYNIFKSQPLILPQNLQSQTILHHFFKLFLNNFFHPIECDEMSKIICLNMGLHFFRKDMFVTRGVIEPSRAEL